MEILAWVDRGLDMRPDQIFIYHIGPSNSWREFVEAGPRDTVPDAANAQLLGFIAGAAWYDGYILSTMLAIKAFVEPLSIFCEAVRQLRVQVILDWKDARFFCLVGGLVWFPGSSTFAGI